MSKDKVIGGHITISYENLLSAKKIGLDRRDSVLMMFYGIENLVLAAFISEDIDLRDVRLRKGRNHHLDLLIEELPDKCHVKEQLMELAILSEYSTGYRYPTSAGRIPKPPSLEKTQEWFIQSKTLLNKFLVHFMVDVKAPNPVAKNTLPLRKPEPYSSPGIE